MLALYFALMFLPVTFAQFGGGFFENMFGGHQQQRQQQQQQQRQGSGSMWTQQADAGQCCLSARPFGAYLDVTRQSRAHNTSVQTHLFVFRAPCYAHAPLRKISNA